MDHYENVGLGIWSDFAYVVIGIQLWYLYFFYGVVEIL